MCYIPVWSAALERCAARIVHQNFWKLHPEVLDKEDALADARLKFVKVANFAKKEGRVFESETNFIAYYKSALKRHFIDMAYKASEKRRVMLSVEQDADCLDTHPASLPVTAEAAELALIGAPDELQRLVRLHFTTEPEKLRFLLRGAEAPQIFNRRCSQLLGIKDYRFTEAAARHFQGTRKMTLFEETNKLFPKMSKTSPEAMAAEASRLISELPDAKWEQMTHELKTWSNLCIENQKKGVELPPLLTPQELEKFTAATQEPQEKVSKDATAATVSASMDSAALSTAVDEAPEIDPASIIKVGPNEHPTPPELITGVIDMSRIVNASTVVTGPEPGTEPVPPGSDGPAKQSKPAKKRGRPSKKEKEAEQAKLKEVQKSVEDKNNIRRHRDSPIQDRIFSIFVEDPEQSPGEIYAQFCTQYPGDTTQLSYVTMVVNSARNLLQFLTTNGLSFSQGIIRDEQAGEVVS